jgi:molybdate transport system ATP-binding protein
MLDVSIKKTVGHFELQTSFQMNKGILGILGSSGCGKSMTLKCLSGLLTPDEGTITLNGKTLYASHFKINVPSRKRNIGYVFQNYALFPHLTVFNNIAYGLNHLEKNSKKQKVWDMIQRMQLIGLENHYPSQLSGGQQQRTALARTLITEPDLLLLDEPFSALDNHVKQLLEKEFISIIQNNYDGIVLLVTHNVEEAYRICDTIMIMDRGEMLQIGNKNQIINSPTSLIGARITGCKNLLNVIVLEEKEEYFILKSNDLIFKAQKKMAPLAQHMIAGIRAHHIRLVPFDTSLDNTFICTLIEKIEGLFSTTLLVNCKGCILQLEISNASNPHLNLSPYNELNIYIPPEQIFMMNH